MDTASQRTSMMTHQNYTQVIKQTFISCCTISCCTFECTVERYKTRLTCNLICQSFKVWWQNEITTCYLPWQLQPATRSTLIMCPVVRQTHTLTTPLRARAADAAAKIQVHAMCNSLIWPSSRQAQENVGPWNASSACPGHCYCALCQL